MQDCRLQEQEGNLEEDVEVYLKELWKKRVRAESLYKERKLSAIEISKKLEISKTTLYKYLKIRNVPIGG